MASPTNSDPTDQKRRKRLFWSHEAAVLLGGSPYVPSLMDVVMAFPIIFLGFSNGLNVSYRSQPRRLRLASTQPSMPVPLSGPWPFNWLSRCKTRNWERSLKSSRFFFSHVVNPAMIFQWGIRFFPLYGFCLYQPFLVKVGITTTAAFLTEELLISLQDVAAVQTLRHCHVIVKWNWQWETVNIC